MPMRPASGEAMLGTHLCPVPPWCQLAVGRTSTVQAQSLWLRDAAPRYEIPHCSRHILMAAQLRTGQCSIATEQGILHFEDLAQSVRKQAVHCHLWLPDLACPVLHLNAYLPLLSLCYLDHTVKAGRTIQTAPSKHQCLSTNLSERNATGFWRSICCDISSGHCDY